MSKHNRQANLQAHLAASGQDRSPDWCPGCGHYHTVNGVHRADCTAVVNPDWCPGCKYYRAVHGFHRADCTAERPQDGPAAQSGVTLPSRASGDGLEDRSLQVHKRGGMASGRETERVRDGTT